jgi:hypothetical protein
MVDLGKRAGVNTVALVTAMDIPLGLTAGNALEVRESIEVLSGGGPDDVVELTVLLAREMLDLVGIKDADPAAALKNGKAMDVWRQMISAQGGDPDAKLPVAGENTVVTAQSSGTILSMDAMKVGMAAVQRDGMEYEFDITGTMEQAELTVDGIRGTELESLVGRTFKKPGEDFIAKIVAFLDDSKAPEPQQPPQTKVTPAATPEDVYTKCKQAIETATIGTIQSVANRIMKTVEAGRLSQDDGSTLLALCESQQVALGIPQQQEAPI